MINSTVVAFMVGAVIGIAYALIKHYYFGEDK